MADKVNIFVEIRNSDLKSDLFRRLSDDWTINWTLIGRAENKADPNATDIAIIDNCRSLELLKDKVVKIFCGSVEDKKSYFAILENPDAENLFKNIKRALSFREITRQNEASQYSEKYDKNSLEAIAETLTVHIHQLTRQSEMRIALVEQLPVGVLGIDDENIVVMANQKAIEILAVEDIPIWGLGVDSLLGEAVGSFIRKDDQTELTINRYGHSVIIRKAQFILDDSFAGIILVLWKPSEKQ